MAISNRVNVGLGVSLAVGSLIYAAYVFGGIKNENLETSQQISADGEVKSVAVHTEGIKKALQGDYAHAIDNYDRALALSPNNPEIYYNRAVAHYSVGNTRLAIQDFDRAIELQPSMAEAYANRGAIRLEAGDTAGALADAQEAVDLLEQQGQADLAAEIKNQFQIVQK